MRSTLEASVHAGSMLPHVPACGSHAHSTTAYIHHPDLTMPMWHMHCHTCGIATYILDGCVVVTYRQPAVMHPAKIGTGLSQERTAGVKQYPRT